MDTTHRKREQRSYISGLATGQRMTTRYSRREGAPLQEWAGGNEGCWATARPAAPPPAPSRDALAKSTSSLSPRHPLVRTFAPSFPFDRPRTRGAIHRFNPAILPTNAILRSYSSSSRFLRFFRSFRRPPNSCPSPIAFFHRILYFSCRPCALRASRSLIAYLSPRAVDPA